MLLKFAYFWLNISTNFEDSYMRTSSIDTHTTLAKRCIQRCLNVGLVRSTVTFAECSENVPRVRTKTSPNASVRGTFCVGGVADPLFWLQCPSVSVKQLFSGCCKVCCWFQTTCMAYTRHSELRLLCFVDSVNDSSWHCSRRWRYELKTTERTNAA